MLSHPQGTGQKIIKTRLGFPGWIAAPVKQKFCLDQMWCWGLSFHSRLWVWETRRGWGGGPGGGRAAST